MGTLICPHCGGAVWTARVIGFIGSARMLYHYAKLIGFNPRYARPDVWGCDACELAGLLPLKLQ